MDLLHILVAGAIVVMILRSFNLALAEVVKLLESMAKIPPLLRQIRRNRKKDGRPRRKG